VKPLKDMIPRDLGDRNNTSPRATWHYWKWFDQIETVLHMGAVKISIRGEIHDQYRNSRAPAWFEGGL